MRRDSNFDKVRDELFVHMNRCKVLQATAEQQREWLDDTMGYMAESHPELSQEQLEELATIGMRFCQPVIPHGKEHTALTVTDTASLAGVA